MLDALLITLVKCYPHAIQCLQSHALFMMAKFLSQNIRVASSRIAYFDQFEPFKLTKAIIRCIRIWFLFRPIQLSPKITKFFDVWRNYVDVVIEIWTNVISFFTSLSFMVHVESHFSSFYIVDSQSINCWLPEIIQILDWNSWERYVGYEIMLFCHLILLLLWGCYEIFGFAFCSVTAALLHNTLLLICSSSQVLHASFCICPNFASKFSSKKSK